MAFNNYFPCANKCNLGVQSNILTLPWPHGSIPSELTDFETQARKLRYQALGAACKDNKLPALLLGHHQDDNIEGVLVRLSRGHRGTGLKGFASVACIPECHGMYGVSGSGSVLSLKDIRSRSKQDETEERPESGPNTRLPKNSARDKQMPISEGGKFIMRPFHSIPKARLLSTCMENGVPFVSDPTNFDYTLTPRNTVRHLLSSDHAPRSFEPASILPLIKESNSSSELLTAASDSILAESRIRSLDRRSGRLLIEFPSFPGVTVPDPPNTAEVDEEFGRERQVQAIAIRRVLDLVSPRQDNKVRLEQLRPIPEKIFPKDDGTTNLSVSPNTFTLGGVQFQPAEPGDRTAKPNTWILTREPFSNRRKSTITTAIPSITGLGSDRQAADVVWSDWHLWDNRYWIRARAIMDRRGNRSADPISITIRPLEAIDIEYIRHRFVDVNRKAREATERSRNSQSPIRKQYHYMTMGPVAFSALLADCAPRKLRFTLPVIAEAGGEGRVLELPTLGLYVPPGPGPDVKRGENSQQGPADMSSDTRDQHHLWTLKSEIKYKSVDPEVLKLTQANV